jgi:peptidoglycan hydrolase CwlO-like protein|tara:strand:+ start:370 stop:549 length:180 start_codon:yes stop_codon:yes gene_type:complete
MAKTVSRKVNKATTVSKKDENIDYLGNKLADLSERINEVELSMESLGKDIKRVMGRMGL